MRLSSFVSTAIFYGTVLSVGIVFDPILQPQQGDILQVGTVYTIKWTSTETKPVKLTLQDGKSNEDDKAVLVIKGK